MCHGCTLPVRWPAHHVAQPPNVARRVVARSGCPCLPLTSRNCEGLRFPSPAADYEEERLDINHYLVRSPISTFFFPVQGDSMEGAEIFDGDILVVDKAVTPRHGHIVVAFVNGGRLVKRLHSRHGQVALIAENPAYPPLVIQEGAELVIWGVVVGKFKRFAV